MDPHGGGNPAICSRIHSYGLEVLVPRTISLRPSLEVVVLVRAAGGEFPGGRDRVFWWWFLVACASGQFFCYAELSVARSRSADLQSWLGFPKLRAACCVCGDSWEICCLEGHSAICLEFLLGGMKSLFQGISPPQEASSRTQQILHSEVLVEDSAGTCMVYGVEVQS